MDVYTLDGQIKDRAAQLPVPGTYKTWRLIDEPNWASSSELRSLDDPLLDEALDQLNKKRNKALAHIAKPRFSSYAERRMRAET